MSARLVSGDCLDVFGAEPDASFDAYVSDWPAGIAFMGRKWDRADHGADDSSGSQRDRWIRTWAKRAEVMRTKAKPGAYSLTWALPRTAHWTMTALDDAGWQIQDVIVHTFGQGWPKGKAALKPASEHWILARNGSGGALQIDAARVARGDAVPLFAHHGAHKTAFAEHAPGAQERTGETSKAGSWPPNFCMSHAEPCEERGVRRVRGVTGGKVGGDLLGIMNDDGRKPERLPIRRPGLDDDGLESVPAFDCLAACDCGLSVLAPNGGEPPRCACGAAMWWACPVAEMDRQSGILVSSGGTITSEMSALGYGGGKGSARECIRDSGGASRFFPCFGYFAKASGGERDAGAEHLLWRVDKRNPFGFSRVTREEWETLPEDERARGNVHPTVKRIALMECLVSLVCPPGGRLGDVTLGSGGTAIALHRLNTIRGLGASFLGSDICPEAVEIAEARLAWWRAVRHDVAPVRREEPTAAESRQRTIFDAIEGRP